MKADYERYFDAKLKMDYRNSTIKALDLTREEFIAFDLIFNIHMEKKQKLVEEGIELIEDFINECMRRNSMIEGFPIIINISAIL